MRAGLKSVVLHDIFTLYVIDAVVGKQIRMTIPPRPELHRVI